MNPARGRQVKFDFPQAKKGVKIFFGGALPKIAPPPSDRGCLTTPPPPWDVLEWLTTVGGAPPSPDFKVGKIKIYKSNY